MTTEPLNENELYFFWGIILNGLIVIATLILLAFMALRAGYRWLRGAR